MRIRSRHTLFHTAVYCLLFCTTFPSPAQQVATLRHYVALASQSAIQDKNFYLLTLFQEQPMVRALLASDHALLTMKTGQRSMQEKAIKLCEKDRACVVNAFIFSAEDIRHVSERLQVLTHEVQMSALIQEHIRASGYFFPSATKTDADLLVSAWEQCAQGINNILAVYGNGKKGMYPRIDSVTYSVNSPYYQDAVYLWAKEIDRSQGKSSLFFEASLGFALALLDINNRDEATRYEPLRVGENRDAIARVGNTPWKEYPYASIIILGAVSELYNSKLPPLGKLNLRLGAENFRKGLAPIVIVSGGHVHPFRTPVCEAIEMKRELMGKYGIPEDRIIVEPHARHTTTNIRNATRLMVQYGIPIDKKSLITTNDVHSAYVESKVFSDRCLRELGYLPGIIQERISPSTVEFLPQLISLARDSRDPLDP